MGRLTRAACFLGVCATVVVVALVLVLGDESQVGATETRPFRSLAAAHGGLPPQNFSETKADILLATSVDRPGLSYEESELPDWLLWKSFFGSLAPSREFVDHAHEELFLDLELDEEEVGQLRSVGGRYLAALELLEVEARSETTATGHADLPADIRQIVVNLVEARESGAAEDSAANHAQQLVGLRSSVREARSVALGSNKQHMQEEKQRLVNKLESEISMTLDPNAYSYLTKWIRQDSESRTAYFGVAPTISGSTIQGGAH